MSSAMRQRKLFKGVFKSKNHACHTDKGDRSDLVHVGDRFKCPECKKVMLHYVDSRGVDSPPMESHSCPKCNNWWYIAKGDNDPENLVKYEFYGRQS